jgi:hypothetical protein
MKVMWPFEHFIFMRQMNVYIVNMLFNNDINIYLDTKIYQLILFNLIQNGVKFN